MYFTGMIILITAGLGTMNMMAKSLTEVAEIQHYSIYSETRL